MCQEEGGYYAIKGFLFQYDKSILELLSSNDDTRVFIERIQDIDYDNYVLQVKHKETAEFSNSKIREPIIKLLDIFISEQSKKFCLYAYFKNQKPHKVKFKKVEDIKEILVYRDKEKTEALYAKYSDDILEKFIQNFCLCFSENFEEQFSNVLDKISLRMGVSRDEAWIYHAIISDKLFKIVLRDNPEERYITFNELKSYVEECRSLTFENMYKEIIGREQFLKSIKKKYFTFKSPNLNNYERLFLIECNNYENAIILRQIIDLISNRYYKKGKSPAPYICFRNLDKKILNDVKRGLIDDNQKFSDGTYFDGDYFRKEKLRTDDDVKIKFIFEEKIDTFTVDFKEVYEFYMKRDTQLCEKSYKICIQIESIDEIKSLI